MAIKIANIVFWAKPVVSVSEGASEGALVRLPFDRKAYQREYMRKWRAAKKAAELARGGDG